MTYYKKGTDTIIIKNSNLEGLRFYGHCQGFSRKGRTYEEVAKRLVSDAWCGWKQFSTKGIQISRFAWRKPTPEEYAKRKAWHEEQEAKALATIIEIEAR